jgi:hypothetical protein
VGTLTSLSSGAITTTGTLALNASGGITTNQTTFNLVNTTATTLNIGGAATTVSLGASTGTTTVNNALAVTGSLLGSSLVATADTGRYGTAAIRFRNGTTNGQTLLVTMPNGTNTQSGIRFYNNDDATGTNLGAAELSINAATVSLSPLAFGTGTTPTNFAVGLRTTVTTSGADGIVIAPDTATTSNSGRLFFTTATSGNAFVLFNTSGTIFNINWGGIPGSTSGSITAMNLTSTGNMSIAGTFTESSSIVYKENVMPIANALDAVMSLVGVTYDRKNGSGKNEAGLIAEDVDKVLPNLVKHREDGSAEGIQYTKLTAYLVEAIKSLKAEIEYLKGNK